MDLVGTKHDGQGGACARHSIGSGLPGDRGGDSGGICHQCSGSGSDDARALVQTLLGVKTANVTDLVGDIDNYRRRAIPLLRNVVDGKDSTPKQKLHASLALLTYDPSQADYLLEQLLSAEVEEVPVIITLLEPHKSRVQQRLWEAVKKGTSSARLRAAAALAAYDPENPEWQKVRSDVVTAFVSVDSDRIQSLDHDAATRRHAARRAT